MSAPEPTTWGPWALDRERLVLELVVEGEYLYDVDLERCGNAAAVLDWLAQLAGKSWATPGIIGQLVAALCDLLDPQARLCGGKGDERSGERTDQLRERLLHAEIRTRAWRLVSARARARAQEVSGDPSLMFQGGSMGEWWDAEARATAEVRREFGLPEEAER
jgi:hypothetical protein